MIVKNYRVPNKRSLAPFYHDFYRPLIEAVFTLNRKCAIGVSKLYLVHYMLYVTFVFQALYKLKHV